jgi:hypothetical protein
MKTKKDNYTSGKKLPWHFDSEDEFRPLITLPKLRV